MVYVFIDVLVEAAVTMIYFVMIRNLTGVNIFDLGYFLITRHKASFFFAVLFSIMICFALILSFTASARAALWHRRRAGGQGQEVQARPRRRVRDAHRSGTPPRGRGRVRRGRVRRRSVDWRYVQPVVIASLLVRDSGVLERVTLESPPRPQLPRFLPSAHHPWAITTPRGPHRPPGT